MQVSGTILGFHGSRKRFLAAPVDVPEFQVAAGKIVEISFVKNVAGINAAAGKPEAEVEKSGIATVDLNFSRNVLRRGGSFESPDAKYCGIAQGAGRRRHFEPLGILGYPGGIADDFIGKRIGQDPLHFFVPYGERHAGHAQFGRFQRGEFHFQIGELQSAARIGQIDPDVAHRRGSRGALVGDLVVYDIPVRAGEDRLQNFVDGRCVDAETVGEEIVFRESLSDKAGICQVVRQVNRYGTVDVVYFALELALRGVLGEDSLRGAGRHGHFSSNHQIVFAVQIGGHSHMDEEAFLVFR